MRNRLLIIASTLTLLELAGCYPVKQTYFTPSAPTGVTLPNDCHHQIGALGSIIFKLDGVVLLVIMHPELSSLSLLVEGIKHNKVSLGSDPFAIASRQGIQAIVPKDISEIENTPDGRQHTHRLQYEDGIHMRSGRIYDFTFEGLPMTAEQFTFSVPPLTTGTKRLEIPSITFTKITEWRMNLIVLNC